MIRADSSEQLVAAVKRIRALLARPDLRAQRSGLLDEVIVEGYLEGQEYAVEGLLTDGQLRVLAVFDKPDPLIGPFFEETIYVTPPPISAARERAIAAEVQRATSAIGLVHGPIHAECRVGPGGVVMLEVAARPIGGACSKVLRFQNSAGEIVSLEEVLLRHACGDDVSGYVRETRASGVMMIPIPKRGMYKSVAGEPEARAVPARRTDTDHGEARSVAGTAPRGRQLSGIHLRGSAPTPIPWSRRFVRRTVSWHSRSSRNSR